MATKLMRGHAVQIITKQSRITDSDTKNMTDLSLVYLKRPSMEGDLNLG